jgi:hypothetical protein
MTCPIDPCEHEELHEGLDGCWLICDRCHRLVVVDRVADRIAEAVLAGEDFTYELVIAKVREAMDEWTPTYYELEDAPARTP